MWFRLPDNVFFVSHHHDNQQEEYVFRLGNMKQGKFEGVDSCDGPNNLTQIGFKS